MEACSQQLCKTAITVNSCKPNELSNENNRTLMNLGIDIMQLVGKDLEARMCMVQVHTYFRNIFHRSYQSDLIAMNQICELAKSLCHNRQHKLIMNSLLNDRKRQFVHTTLTDLNVQGVVQIIKHNLRLQELELYKNRLDDGDISTYFIAKALHGNISLRTLKLFYNDVGDPGAKSIATALKINTSLTTLLLGMNEISDAGAKDLADALKINTSLQILGLYDNSIGDCGAKDLAEALTINTTLKEVSLAFNSIGNLGVKELASSLDLNTNIEQLALDNNPVDDVLIDELVNKHLGRITYTVYEDSD